MHRIFVMLLVSLSLGCATTIVEAVVEGDTVRVGKMSVMRKGPYSASITVPVPDGVVTVQISGNDEAMSGNLAATGALIGAAAGGAPGAAAGGIVGAAVDWVKKKVDANDLETIDPTTEVPE
jgi:hypothetical protein